MEKMKKVGTLLLNIILIFVVLCTIIFSFSFIQMKLKKTKHINLFGYTILQVETGSMADTINIKDIVVVKLTKDVSPNDIITYLQKDVLITHRIVKITDNYIVTKGDANNSLDNPITKDEIIGKVIYIIPKIGIWQKVLATPKVIISGSITILLLYIVSSNKGKSKEECIEKRKE